MFDFVIELFLEGLVAHTDHKVGILQTYWKGMNTDDAEGWYVSLLQSFSNFRP